MHRTFSYPRAERRARCGGLLLSHNAIALLVALRELAGDNAASCRT